MPDLDAIRARLAACQTVVQVNQIFGGKVEDIYLDYERDVAALLAALDAKAQKEADRG